MRKSKIKWDNKRNDCKTSANDNENFINLNWDYNDTAFSQM